MKTVQLVAAAALLSATTSAHAAALTFDFEDGVVGAVYPGTPTDGFSYFDGGKIVEDADGKHLAIGPADIYGYTDFYIHTQSEFHIGEHPFRHYLTLTSFDIFMPTGGEIVPFDVSVPAGVWTTIAPDREFWAYLHIWTIGGDGVLLDNIHLTESTGPIPEPATWAMMIMGFGIVGVLLRRRAVLA